MKIIKSFCVALIALASVASAKAQSVSNVVDAYLEVKNALVAGNASLTATKAKVLTARIAAVKSLDAGQQTIWKKYADKLNADARQISQSGKIDEQRERFAALSSNLYQLVKAAKPNTETLYVQYCPMKKASWLSTRKDIENPYYGHEMLSCGGVKETLAAATKK